MKIMWIIMAGLSAVFAAISTILAKCGTQKTDPDIATTLRTVAVLLCAWLMAAWAGSINTLSDISVKTLIFLLFGGITNAASWIYYYRALSVSTVDKVMPIEKASILLTTIAAIIMFHETNHIFQKLAGVAVILIGVFLICGKECFSENAENNHSWFGQAVLASVFAALNTIISKLGINGIESNLGTAVNISAVLAVMAGILLWKGKAGQIRKFEIKEFLFTMLSGAATGFCWLCYFYAIQQGQVTVTVALNKMSLALAMVLSWIFLGERMSRRECAGAMLLMGGILWIAIHA